jgi:energy-coupling factor transporter ATP-binding protein EcfA2
VIKLEDLTFSFEQAESPVLKRVNLRFSAGEFALISGPTGSGKSTLLRAINGLVPHFSSGLLTGRIWLDGMEFGGAKPHQLAHLVGFVNQQPEGAFVADTVLEELAYGMEQLGFTEVEMKRRIQNTAERFGLADLLSANLSELSGGQQQRVAIAAALVAGQKILLLDEPTSALDSKSAAELITLLRSLATESGITVLLAEHRIERAIGIVDSVTVVHGDGSVSKAQDNDGLDQVLRDYRMVPPVVELGQKLGWTPLALSVAKARQLWLNGKHPVVSLDSIPNMAEPQLTATSLSVSYGSHLALHPIDVNLTPGCITAVIGPNGSGKTSLLWAMQGQLEHTGTVILADGREPRKIKPIPRLAELAMVPQWAADLLMLNSIAQEMAESDAFAQVEQGTTAKLFSQLAGRIDPARHPRDLSAGQQLALVLAIQLAKGARVLLLDEPTRGLDYESKKQLATQLGQVRNQGKAILLASHDVEFIALVADQILQLESGRLVAHGPAQRVLSELGANAPQVWQVTEQAIRVDQVVAG